MRTRIASIVLVLTLLVTALLVWPPRISFADTRMERVNKARALSCHIMGFIYDLYGLTPQAADVYEEAVNLDPKSYLTHLRLGSDYARLGRFKEAVDHLVLIPALNPQDIQSHYLLALIYSTQKKFDSAASEYEQILRSIPSDNTKSSEVYFYLGEIYYSQHQYDKAVVQFEKILAVEPENVEMMYFLGSLYVEIDRRDKAVDLFKKALLINPEHDGILNSLGYVYAEQGNNLEEAMSLVNRALTIDPDNGAYLDSLGWVYFKKGNYVEALKMLMKADAKIKDSAVYEHIGDVQMALKQEVEAKKYWRMSLELKPDQKRILEKINRQEKSQVVSGSK